MIYNLHIYAEVVSFDHVFNEYQMKLEIEIMIYTNNFVYISRIK